MMLSIPKQVPKYLEPTLGLLIYHQYAFKLNLDCFERGNDHWLFSPSHRSSIPFISQHQSSFDTKSVNPDCCERSWSVFGCFHLSIQGQFCHLFASIKIF